MNSNLQPNPNQAQNQNKNPAAAAFSSSDLKAELHKVGEQVEAISRKIKAQDPKSDWAGLHEIGNKIEHFLDAERKVDVSSVDKPDAAKGKTI